MTLYVVAPHNLATNVSIAIELQKNFSTYTVIIIGAVAIGAALLVLTWNKRLETTVNTRTDQLRKANELLTESSNRLAAANKQLEIHGKMQQEFIDVAAHELRTPIR